MGKCSDIMEARKSLPPPTTFSKIYNIIQPTMLGNVQAMYPASGKGFSSTEINVCSSTPLEDLA